MLGEQIGELKAVLTESVGLESTKRKLSEGDLN